MNILIVGAGRAGSAFARALVPAHHVTLMHYDELPTTTPSADQSPVDLVLLCVPDDAIASTAARLAVAARTVVAHVSGSRGLDVLGPHPRVGSMHPLAALPDAAVGARRLREGVFAVEGDELIDEVVASLGARSLTLAPGQRTIYHATATAAASHLVALMAHVGALAEHAGLELRDFLPLARQALDDVVERGPAHALTGAASRGDVATLTAHVRALPDDERSTYVALAQRAQRLAGTTAQVSWNE